MVEATSVTTTHLKPSNRNGRSTIHKAVTALLNLSNPLEHNIPARPPLLLFRKAPLSRNRIEHRPPPPLHMTIPPHLRIPGGIMKLRVPVNGKRHQEAGGVMLPLLR